MYEPSIPAHTAKEGEKLTPHEVSSIEEFCCPDCGARLVEGPSGGLSQNFRCGFQHCGSRFNVMGPFGVERISDARPERQPLPVTTYRDTQA